MNFTAKEIEHLLKLMRKYKIKEFKNDGLHVIHEVPPYEPKVRATIPRPPILNPGLTEKREKLSKELLLKQEFETKQEKLERMLIEDPAQFEELLLSGDLEDEGTETKDG